MTTFVMARAKTTEGTLILCRKPNQCDYAIIMNTEHGNQLLEEIKGSKTLKGNTDKLRKLWNEYCLAYALRA